MKNTMNELDIAQKIEYVQSDLLFSLTEEGRITEIPKGYFWCHDCEALTPHESEGKFGWDHCIICGNHKSHVEDCPNCGWDVPEDISDEEEVILHRDGCHCKPDYGDNEILPVWYYGNYSEYICRQFKQDFLRPFPERGSYCLPEDNEWYNGHKKLMKRWIEALNMKCNCPRYTIYRNLNIFNYESHSVYSQDCMNAIEWSYSIRCPICGCIFDISDGNC